MLVGPQWKQKKANPNLVDHRTARKSCSGIPAALPKSQVHIVVESVSYLIWPKKSVLTIVGRPPPSLGLRRSVTQMTVVTIR